MAKDKDKGKEKGNKPKLSVKDKKLKKKEKLEKKASMVVDTALLSEPVRCGRTDNRAIFSH